MSRSLFAVSCFDSPVAPHDVLTPRSLLVRAEVESLQERVNKERERYHQTTQSSLGGISAVPYISVNDRVGDVS